MEMIMTIFDEGEAWDIVSSFKSGGLDHYSLLAIIDNPTAWLAESESYVAALIRNRRKFDTETGE
jgi:hypothetical protein